MSRSAMFLTIALASSVATPLVVRAAGSTPAATTASVTTSAAPVTSAPADAAAPGCARKVRVVYQGFGPAPDTCVTPR